MSLSVVILAAGLGTRMKSSTPKVLHELYGKPLVQHVVDAAAALKPDRTIVVVSPNNEPIREALEGSGVSFAVQKKPLGTGDALKAALPGIPKQTDTVLVLSGDTPLVETDTLRELLKQHRRLREAVSILTFRAEGHHSYGRIIRDGSAVTAIVEDRDATQEQKRIDEVNSGIYAFKAGTLDLLKAIRMNAAKGEYYLTDLVAIARRKGSRIGAHPLGTETELTGINTRAELSRAGRYLRDRITSGLFAHGVSFVDPGSVFIDPRASIGNDTLIYPNVHIEGACVIGSGCVIYPNTRIVESVLGVGITVKDCTVIESSVLKDGSAVGPFAHLRPGSTIGEDARIGNFVEVKKSVIGRGSKASHLSYLGDAEIGEDVNIGAGTITCNYDGVNKNKTVIEQGVFIGSDTQLVAPVRVCKGSYVGAGSTITHDVPPYALAITRTPQRNIDAWALTKSPKARRRREQTARKSKTKKG